MIRIDLGRALEQFPRLDRLATLHHPQPEFVQHGRMRGRELRGARQQLVRLALAALGSRGLGSLKHAQDFRVVRAGSIDVAQGVPLWCLVCNPEF